jgi:hypothetical protein
MYQKKVIETMYLNGAVKNTNIITKAPTIGINLPPFLTSPHTKYRLESTSATDYLHTDEQLDASGHGLLTTDYWLV